MKMLLRAWDLANQSTRSPEESDEPWTPQKCIRGSQHEPSSLAWSTVPMTLLLSELYVMVVGHFLAVQKLP